MKRTTTLFSPLRTSSSSSSSSFRQGQTTFASGSRRKGGVSSFLLHAAAFVSGGVAMSALLSLPPAAHPIALYSRSPAAHYASSPSPASSASSSSVSTNSLAFAPSSSSSEPSSRASSSSLPSLSASVAENVDAAPVSATSTPTLDQSRPSSVFSFLRPHKYKSTTPHFALGELPLFAKASLTIGKPLRTVDEDDEVEDLHFEYLDGEDDGELQTKNATSTAMRLSFQLRRSSKTIDEIEEEYYWQEGEEQDDDEDW